MGKMNFTRGRAVLGIFLFMFILDGLKTAAADAPAWAGGKDGVHWRNPNIHEVNLYLRMKILKFREDLALGKVTPEQARAFFEKVRNVRQMESKLFFGHGKQDVTESEKNQLKAMAAQP